MFPVFEHKTTIVKINTQVVKGEINVNKATFTLVEGIDRRVAKSLRRLKQCKENLGEKK